MGIVMREDNAGILILIAGSGNQHTSKCTLSIDLQGEYEMIKYPMYLSSVEDAVQFVSIINHFEYDMNLRYGTTVVDAKSLMSVLGMGIGRKVILEVMANVDDKFTGAIQNYMVMPANN